MKVLMFYELSEDGMGKVPSHMGAHQARLREFHGRGVLLMAGPYGAPPVGALGVFTSRAAAEEFARDDPFMLNGIVGKCTFHEWNEDLA
ncbi:MAG TPA: YciI family protein [Ramlibacter sp.]|jgi:uncharacterized protein YciI|nr:YciI family protein [Ramlibacter sp.]